MARFGVAGRSLGRDQRSAPFQDFLDEDPDWGDEPTVGYSPGDRAWTAPEEADEVRTVAWPRRFPDGAGYRDAGYRDAGYRDAGRPSSRRGRRRRIPLRVKWVAALVVLGLIFRKAIAFAVLAVLSGALHLVGVNMHLPHVKLAWPWTSITAGTVTDTPVGPWVLQKIEGISKPALGTENFNFTFTHKVSKNIGFWPCWYSSTFDTVGHASATVSLNPGSSWWAPSAGHYRLQVLSRPAQGQPGRVSVAMVLPQPQLPRSVHDVTVDDTLSHPLDVQHSWTYPGFGCGGLIRPQFSVSVLYGQAQSIAFYQATHNAAITAPLIRAAETEATTMIRDNFIQPTLNALGYTLTGFTLGWTSDPGGSH